MKQRLQKNEKQIAGIALLFALLTISFFYDIYNFFPQGHGSIVTYSFEIPKYKLEQKVDSLISNSEDVKRKQLSQNDIEYYDDNYYNTGGYFTVYIDRIELCYRYYGDSAYWSNSPNESAFFLVSVNSEDNEKGIEEIIKLSEDKFVNKLSPTLIER